MKGIIARIEEIRELGGLKKDITLLVLAGISLIISIFDLIPGLPFDAAWVSVILCGVPILMDATIGMITAFDIKADVLVAIALLASLYIGEDFAAGEVAFIMELGSLLENLTVAKARAGIEKLVHLTPQTARVLTADGEKVVSAEEVRLHDRIRVLPGETIPVDGVILSGTTSINQAVMTGESLPVDKTAGDSVSSGTVNQFGAFEMQATRVGEDSSIQRMIRLVQSADAGKAKIVTLADRWATWVVLIALSAAILTWFFTGELIRSVTILVVFCPCALVLATPTAIMAAIGNATKHGFLVKEGDALERLASVSRISFDKTGTLTHGTPEVTAVKTLSSFSEKEIYTLAAAAEQLSEHPLGKAVLRCYRATHGKELPPAESFTMIPGAGVRARVEGREIMAGNLKLLKDIALPSEAELATEAYLSKGCTIIYLAADKAFAGYIVLSDTLREESADMIRGISSLGVKPVLMTGDNSNAASSIGQQLAIPDIHAHCLPEDKLHFIGEYQNKGEKVCMIGDGVNDAPALKKANVGIAMGGVGSDIAVDAADIALVDDEIKEIPHLLALSKRMMTTIKINLTFSMSLNFLAILLAMTGMLGPVVGALVHNAGSVAVIINSAFLLSWKQSATE